jgi:type I restriction enzyme S subunit
MSWELKSFNELGFIGRGKSRHRPRNEASLYGGDFPLIQTGDVKNANLYITEYSQTYSQKGLDQSRLWEPNTLCITIAANIADTTILGIQACFPDSIIGFIANDEVCDVRFIKYHFDIVQKQMQMVSQGATQDNLSLEKLLKFKVPTPPLPTQKRIASILSAYDDSIENNLKRIKLLEETAQNIYKEWFVHFRFPNHEHTAFDAESGLPVGWKKGKVSGLCDVKSGYAFKSKDWQSEGNPVMKIKNITNNTVDINDCDYVDDEVAKNADKFELFEGDVLIAMTGATVGKVGLIPKIDKRIYINQRVGLFRPNSETINNVGLIFTFFMTEDGLKQILNFAGGAAQPNISSSQISNVELNIATVDILAKFNDVIKSLLIQIQTLYSQNQKLKEARDILLPRLMNRTIEV